MGDTDNGGGCKQSEFIYNRDDRLARLCRGPFVIAVRDVYWTAAMAARSLLMVSA
jgi:hypothetical protein